MLSELVILNSSHMRLPFIARYPVERMTAPDSNLKSLASTLNIPMTQDLFYHLGSHQSPLDCRNTIQVCSSLFYSRRRKRGTIEKESGNEFTTLRPFTNLLEYRCAAFSITEYKIAFANPSLVALTYTSLLFRPHKLPA